MQAKDTDQAAVITASAATLAMQQGKPARDVQPTAFRRLLSEPLYVGTAVVRGRSLKPEKFRYQFSPYSVRTNCVRKASMSVFGMSIVDETDGAASNHFLCPSARTLPQPRTSALRPKQPFLCAFYPRIPETARN